MIDVPLSRLPDLDTALYHWGGVGDGGFEIGRMDMKTPEEIIAQAIKGKGGPEWRRYLPEARADIEALDAAGYVIAPKEPTEEMLIAGVHHENMGDMAGRYKAMLAAAQTKESPPTG